MKGLYNKRLNSKKVYRFLPRRNDKLRKDEKPILILSLIKKSELVMPKNACPT